MTGRIAVAVSGAGSNLRALHEAARGGRLGGAIVLVVADRPCPALDWAAEEGIDTALVPGGADDALRETARDWEEKLSKYAVELGFREDLYDAVKQYAATAEAGALAVPVLDADGACVAAVGFNIPLSRLDDARIGALVPELLAATGRLSPAWLGIAVGDASGRS